MMACGKVVSRTKSGFKAQTTIDEEDEEESGGGGSEEAPITHQISCQGTSAVLNYGSEPNLQDITSSSGRKGKRKQSFPATDDMIEEIVFEEDRGQQQQHLDAVYSDSVSSPGGSSTTSEPATSLVRTVGFEHYAQEVRKAAAAAPASVQVLARGKGAVVVDLTKRMMQRPSLKPDTITLSVSGLGAGAAAVGEAANSNTLPRGAKKKKQPGGLNSRISLDSAQPKPTKKISTNQRAKPRKEPLPMKQRALPQSFWQEPNVTHLQAPAGGGGRGLPPLCDVTDDCDVSSQSSSVTSLQYQTPSSSSSSSDSSSKMRDSSATGSSSARMTVTAANTDLLFSLFNSVEEEEEQRRIHIVRRGRPKKSSSLSNAPRLARSEDDPCLNSTVTESILPLIPERQSSSSSSSSSQNRTGQTSSAAAAANHGTQVIRIMSINTGGDKTVELPSLNVEHNYPHLLSELVMKL